MILKYIDAIIIELLGEDEMPSNKCDEMPEIASTEYSQALATRDFRSQIYIRFGA